MIKRTLLISLFLIITLFSCEQKSQYNHSDKEQVIQCDAAIDALLNEALYVFEDDISKSYNENEGEGVNIAYARYIYVGFAGTAEYERIASQNALDIHKSLLEQNILIKNGFKSNLNYNHPTVQCIIDKMEDKGLSTTIKALIDTNTMDPKLFATRMRSSGRTAVINRYVSIYVALDTYFQQLDGIVLPVQEGNE